MMRATLLRGRLRQQLGARRGLDDAPVFIDHDAIAQPIGFGQIVGDQHRGDTPPVRILRSSSRSAWRSGSVERGQRLVQQQQGRIGGERPAERHALPLAARELARVALRERIEAERLERPRPPGAPLGPAAIAEAEAHVVRAP